MTGCNILTCSLVFCYGSYTLLKGTAMLLSFPFFFFFLISYLLISFCFLESISPLPFLKSFQVFLQSFDTFSDDKPILHRFLPFVVLMNKHFAGTVHGIFGALGCCPVVYLFLSLQLEHCLNNSCVFQLYGLRINLNVLVILRCVFSIDKI